METKEPAKFNQAPINRNEAKIMDKSSSKIGKGDIRKKTSCSEKHPSATPEDGGEVLELPSREIEGRTSHTNLQSLYELSPDPQPPLTEKQIRMFKKSQDQASIMAEQVQRMKKGMEKLQEITQKFNCMESFKRDVDYLVDHLPEALEESGKKSDGAKK